MDQKSTAGYREQMDLRRLPKIELHLHLDCSLSYQAVSALAPSVSREEYQRDFIAPTRCANLADFLSRAPKGFQLMQTEDSLRLVTEDVFRQLIEDGVIYAEIRFAPLLHTERGLGPERVVAVVERSVDRLIRVTGMQAGLILCTLRHFTEAQSLLTAELVEKFRGSRVVALDLAGDEAGFPLDAHIGAYRYAREHGLHRTAHAGEALGPESVWETLRLLDPQRIGHGTRSIEDSKLVEHLRSKRIHLELCPTANVQIIPSIGNMEEHPIDHLCRAGVSLNVNSDSRMLTPTTLTAEYESLSRAFNWTGQELLQTNLLGLDAAFVNDEVKKTAQETTSGGLQWSTARAGLVKNQSLDWYF
ncbi:MAG TPA: adenosine deaminase [Verrucomicrobiae bacterium]|nr:adenosine deaminase [Verrucomicrobiae bacterium]